MQTTENITFTGGLVVATSNISFQYSTIMAQPTVHCLDNNTVYYRQLRCTAAQLNE